MEVLIEPESSLHLHTINFFFIIYQVLSLKRDPAHDKS